MNRSVALLMTAALFATGSAHARTRSAVVNEALGMVATPTAWTVIHDSTGWPNGFEWLSADYDIGQSYTDWPYVYGGRETRSTSVTRINSGTPPGGVNADGITTSQIYNVYKSGKLSPANFLAGVDCAGFAEGAIFGEAAIPQHTNENAAALAAESVLIDGATAAPGDLIVELNSSGEPGGHVQVITAIDPVSGSPVIMDAFSGTINGVQISKVRAPTTTLGLSNFAFYTPFPELNNGVPADGSTIQNTTPMIQLPFCTGIDIPVISMQATLDGTAIQFGSHEVGN